MHGRKASGKPCKFPPGDIITLLADKEERKEFNSLHLKERLGMI
jgi:hypothetical protein